MNSSRIRSLSLAAAALPHLARGPPTRGTSSTTGRSRSWSWSWSWSWSSSTATASMCLVFRAQRCREPRRPPPSLPYRSMRHHLHAHVSSVLVAPLVFAGLFLALWTYKCMMLVLFQNVIIYNPFLPPNARTMLISDYARQCRGWRWREERIRSLDGTEIALCVGEASKASMSSSSSSSSSTDEGEDQAQARARAPGRRLPSSSKTPVYIMYFQGNASSLPPRLPDLSSVLRHLQELDQDVDLTVVCVSYRGFWTSHDRPSERGINLDNEAALAWVSKLGQDVDRDTAARPAVVLWGQSIGCGFATNLAAKVAQREKTRTRTRTLDIDALILETPFTNTRAMLHALYPQKWLPYQHLWPFLRNHLDSLANLEAIGKGAAEGNSVGTAEGAAGGSHGGASRATNGTRPAVYIVEAGKDELVPHDHGEMLYRRCQEVGLYAERRSIRGALHNDVMVKRDGRQALASSIASAISRSRRREEDSEGRGGERKGDASS